MSAGDERFGWQPEDTPGAEMAAPGTEGSAVPLAGDTVEYHEDHVAAFFDASDRAVPRALAAYAKVWDWPDGPGTAPRVRVIRLDGGAAVPSDDLGEAPVGERPSGGPRPRSRFADWDVSTVEVLRDEG